MLFEIKKNPNNTWDLAPCSGELRGKCVAEVEGVEVAGVEFGPQQIIGTVKAVWGARIIGDEPYADPDTLRALCLNQAFKSKAEIPVYLGDRGFFDTVTNQVVKKAKQALVMGASIYRKG